MSKRMARNPVGSYFFFLASFATTRLTSVPGATVDPAAGSWLRTLPFFFFFVFLVILPDVQPAALSACCASPVGLLVTSGTRQKVMVAWTSSSYSLLAPGSVKFPFVPSGGPVRSWRKLQPVPGTL